MKDMAEIKNMTSLVRGKFSSQAQQVESIGNRSGKSYERGVLEVSGQQYAVEFFTRSVDGEEYADVWNLFNQAGMPVVSELWMDASGKIYLPDLTKDGSGLYGKALEQVAKNSTTKPIDRVFLKVWESQKEKISTMALQLAQFATEQGLLLPLDDPFDLHVSPNGEWQLMCLDLEYGGTLEDLVNRKSRMTQRSAQFPLSEHFGGRSIEQLSTQERLNLTVMINQKSAKTALSTLGSLANKLK